MRDVVFVFVRSGNSYGFVEDTDEHRDTYGKFIPIHEKAGEGERLVDAAHRVLRDEGGIGGKIVDAPYTIPYEMGRRHYFIADVGRTFAASEKRTRWMEAKDIRTYYEKYCLAEWVPEIMRGMKLI